MTQTSAIKLLILPTAAQAIIEQSEYYESKQNADLATRWESAVRKAILALLTFPLQGSLCGFLTTPIADLRRIQFQGSPGISSSTALSNKKGLS